MNMHNRSLSVGSQLVSRTANIHTYSHTYIQSYIHTIIHTYVPYKSRGDICHSQLSRVRAAELTMSCQDLQLDAESAEDDKPRRSRRQLPDGLRDRRAHKIWDRHCAQSRAKVQADPPSFGVVSG